MLRSAYGYGGVAAFGEAPTFKLKSSIRKGGFIVKCSDFEPEAAKRYGGAFGRVSADQDVNLLKGRGRGGFQ